MASSYYKPCKEIDACMKVDQYWHSKEFDKWFEGYYKIATETSYPLAECQVGYSYLEGIGVKQDLKKHYIGRNALQRMVIGMPNII